MHDDPCVGDLIGIGDSPLNRELLGGDLEKYAVYGIVLKVITHYRNSPDLIEILGPSGQRIPCIWNSRVSYVIQRIPLHVMCKWE